MTLKTWIGRPVEQQSSTEIHIYEVDSEIWRSQNRNIVVGIWQTGKSASSLSLLLSSSESLTLHCLVRCRTAKKFQCEVAEIWKNKKTEIQLAEMELPTKVVIEQFWVFLAIALALLSRFWGLFGILYSIYLEIPCSILGMTRLDPL